mmetsp:Transcript_15694/g.31275  ORF Transcript_15694/g.31275 Transcript_15694/m.31275 type:complete len:98 (+) Transcript_15694:138-431(+)
MSQPNNIVNLSKLIEEWSRCVSSNHQRNHLYRMGEFDMCSSQWTDIKAGFRAKITTDPKIATEIWLNTHYKKKIGSDPSNSPTSGVIWELKEEPSWK